MGHSKMIEIEVPFRLRISLLEIHKEHLPSLQVEVDFRANGPLKSEYAFKTKAWFEVSDWTDFQDAIANLKNQNPPVGIDIADLSNNFGVRLSSTQSSRWRIGIWGRVNWERGAKINFDYECSLLESELQGIARQFESFLEE